MMTGFHYAATVKTFKRKKTILKGYLTTITNKIRVISVFEL